jgi:phosphatidylserine/phosphatidylglycerophosphate/cardiolipin synthase-like enzyme
MSINVLFLQERGQQPGQAVNVANRLADFIGSAKKSLHMATYHFSLHDEALIAPVRNALVERAAAGVEIQIGYYDEHHDGRGAHFDPRDSGGVSNPTGTEAFLAEITAGTRIEIRPIRGSHLMHNKYAVCDGHMAQARVWTGSTNFTDGAWKFMENNVVIIGNPDLCAYYENDFQELWKNQDIQGSGSSALDSGTADVDGVRVSVEFSPGMGRQMDQLIASRISAARRRIKISMMVLSSATVLGALADAVKHVQVAEFGGIYDAQETGGALKHATGGTPDLFAVIEPKLVGKRSRTFDPSTPDADYNFMHNKIVVCDDTVASGSFNFSRNATMNAENLLVIESREWADRFADYIDGLVEAYSQGA